jgi:spore coat protein U-like protein
MARLLLGLLLALVFVSGRADAAASCSWRSVVGVAFGAYDVFSASPLDSTGTLTYRCTGGAPLATIDLNRGSAPTFNPRYMLQATEQLNYNLYLDTARTSIWGDATSGTTHYTRVNPPNGQNIAVTIYGRVPAGQDISAGAYADTVVATITF